MGNNNDALPNPRHDPRRVGGQYHCSYWNKTYTVEKIEEIGPTRTRRLLLRWEDGHTAYSFTPWSHHDRVVDQPE